MIQLQSLSHRLFKNKSINIILKPVLLNQIPIEIPWINWPHEILNYGSGSGTGSLLYIDSKKFKKKKYQYFIPIWQHIFSMSIKCQGRIRIRPDPLIIGPLDLDPYPFFRIQRCYLRLTDPEHCPNFFNNRPKITGALTKDDSGWFFLAQIWTGSRGFF